MHISTARSLTLHTPLLPPPPAQDILISHNCFHISGVSRNQEILRDTERSLRQGVSRPFVSDHLTFWITSLDQPQNETEVQTISFPQVMIISAYFRLDRRLPNLFLMTLVVEPLSLIHGVVQCFTTLPCYKVFLMVPPASVLL